MEAGRRARPADDPTSYSLDQAGNSTGYPFTTIDEASSHDTPGDETRSHDTPVDWSHQTADRT